MQTIPFKINTETSNQNTIVANSFEVFLHISDTTATFFFDQDIKITNTETSHKLKIELKEQVSNPVGFAISRIERLVRFNPTFSTVEICGKTLYLKDTSLCKGETRDVSRLSGMEFPSTAKVVVSIVNNGETTDSITYSYNEVKDKGLSLDFKTIKLPKAVDAEDNARYCRNAKINRTIQNAMISVDDANIKDVLEQLSTNARRIATAAKILKCHDVNVLSYSFITRYICNVCKKRWMAKISGLKCHKSIIEDFEFYKTHSLSHDHSFKFRIDDLINLYD